MECSVIFFSPSSLLSFFLPATSFFRIDFSYTVQRTTGSSNFTIGLLIAINAQTRVGEDTWLFFPRFFEILLVVFCWSSFLYFTFLSSSFGQQQPTRTYATGRNGRITVPDGHWWWTRERRQETWKIVRGHSNKEPKLTSRLVTLPRMETLMKRWMKERKPPSLLFIWLDESRRYYYTDFLLNARPPIPLFFLVSCIVRHMRNAKVLLYLLGC